MTLDADFLFGEEINKLKKWNKIDSVHSKLPQAEQLQVEDGAVSGFLNGAG